MIRILSRAHYIMEQTLVPLQSAVSWLRHKTTGAGPYAAMSATAAFLGLFITLLGIHSGLMMLAVLAGVATMSGALYLLYAGTQGRTWALSLSFTLILFTIDATLRRRGDMAASGMDAQTALKVLIWGGAFLIGAVHFSHLKRALLESPPLRWLLAFAVWSLLSTAYSITPTYTFGGGFGYLALLCFVAVIVQAVGIEKLTLPAIYACGLLTTSAVVLYFIVPSMVVALLEGGTTARLAGLTGSPNNLGRTAAIALFFIFFAVRNKQVKLWRFDIALITISSLAALSLSWSRTALVGIVVSIALVYLRRRLVLMLWGLVAVSSTILTMVMVNVDWDRLVLLISRHGSLSELTTLTGRTAIWDFAWGAFLRQPLIGYGYGSTKLLIPSGFRTVFGWTTTSAHNMFLQALVTTGIIGAVFILAAVLLQVRDMAKRPHDMADAAFLFVLISGFSEAGAVGVAPNLLTIFWLISLAIPRHTKEQSNDMSGPTNRLQSVSNSIKQHQKGFPGRGIVTAAIAAAVLSAAPCSLFAQTAKTSTKTTQAIDLGQVFGEQTQVVGKFGWSNVSILTESGKQIARVRYPAGSYDPGSMKLHGKPVGGTGFRLKLPSSDCMQLSYQVRFAPGFPFVKGGKLPGLGGGKGNSGGRIPDGSDGFSTRFMWRSGGAGEVYAYLPTSKVWGTSLGRGDWRMTAGNWNRIEQTVRLNTPGKSDGEISVRLNGKPVHDSQGLRFRDTERLKIDLLIFETFFGGNSPDWAPRIDTYADFADMSVSSCN